MTRILAQVGVLALIASLVGWQSYRAGQSACEAAHNAAMIEALAEGDRLNTARIALKSERDRLARQLEMEANEDPIVVTQCLGPSRVRRLNAIGN